MDTPLSLVRSGAEQSREPQPSLIDLDGLVQTMRDGGGSRR
jgi:hypothetical protein